MCKGVVNEKLGRALEVSRERCFRAGADEVEVSSRACEGIKLSRRHPAQRPESVRSCMEGQPDVVLRNSLPSVRKACFVIQCRNRAFTTGCRGLVWSRIGMGKRKGTEGSHECRTAYPSSPKLVDKVHPGGRLSPGLVNAGRLNCKGIVIRERSDVSVFEYVH